MSATSFNDIVKNRFKNILNKLVPILDSNDPITIIGTSGLVFLEIQKMITEVLPGLFQIYNKFKSLSVQKKKEAIADKLIQLFDAALLEINERISLFRNSQIDEMIWDKIRPWLRESIIGMIEIKDNKISLKKPKKLFCCF